MIVRVAAPVSDQLVTNARLKSICRISCQRPVTAAAATVSTEFEAPIRGLGRSLPFGSGLEAPCRGSRPGLVPATRGADGNALAAQAQNPRIRPAARAAERNRARCATRMCREPRGTGRSGSASGARC